MVDTHNLRFVSNHLLALFANAVLWVWSVEVEIEFLILAIGLLFTGDMLPSERFLIQRGIDL